ncbi:MAG TPA: hypothetical protein VJ824_12875 [Bacillota bacterium]|nr:hypothetical protein [Bacillota bacterium]
MNKPVVRVNIEVLEKLQGKLTDAQFSRKIGVSQSTLYRIKLPPTDGRYSAPGETFIAGVLNAFPKKRFEHIFFLDCNLQVCKKNQKEIP